MAGSKMYYVYMLLCRDDSLYTGITPNLQQRMRQHTGQLKGGARYTALRPPKKIAAVWTAPDRSTASKAVLLREDGTVMAKAIVPLEPERRGRPGCFPK